MPFYDYPALATARHKKPKFLALLEALTAPFAKVQDLLATFPTEFDVDFAVGAQLDAVGLWVGIGRWLTLPLEGVYFSWEEPGPGWDEGIWKGPYDPDSGLTRLDDDSYRRLIKARIAANHWNGTIPGAYAVWAAAFADSKCRLVIQDNQDMSMTVGIAGDYPDAVFKALLMGGYIPLKPEGVRIKWYAVTPDGGPLFAWDCETPELAGWPDELGYGGRWPQELEPLETDRTLGAKND